jgi:hypothetical protein
MIGVTSDRLDPEHLAVLVDKRDYFFGRSSSSVAKSDPPSGPRSSDTAVALTFELADPLGIGGGGAGTAVSVNLGLADPVAQRVVTDAELVGSLCDHTEAAALGVDRVVHSTS